MRAEFIGLGHLGKGHSLVADEGLFKGDCKGKLIVVLHHHQSFSFGRGLLRGRQIPRRHLSVEALF